MPVFIMSDVWSGSRWDKYKHVGRTALLGCQLVELLFKWCYTLNPHSTHILMGNAALLSRAIHGSTFYDQSWPDPDDSEMNPRHSSFWVGIQAFQY